MAKLRSHEKFNMNVGKNRFVQTIGDNVGLNRKGFTFQIFCLLLIKFHMITNLNLVVKMSCHEIFLTL